MIYHTVYLVRMQNEGVMLGVLPSPDVFQKNDSNWKKGKNEISETFRLPSLLNAAKLMF